MKRSAFRGLQCPPLWGPNVMSRFKHTPRTKTQKTTNLEPGTTSQISPRTTTSTKMPVRQTHDSLKFVISLGHTCPVKTSLFSLFSLFFHFRFFYSTLQLLLFHSLSLIFLIFFHFRFYFALQLLLFLTATNSLTLL